MMLAPLYRSILQACEVGVSGLPVFVPSTALPAYQCPYTPKAALAAVNRFSLGNKKPDAMAGFFRAICRRQNTNYGEMMPSAGREVKRPLSSGK